MKGLPLTARGSGAVICAALHEVCCTTSAHELPALLPWVLRYPGKMQACSQIMTSPPLIEIAELINR